MVGKVVRKGIEERLEIRDLRLDKLREISLAFEADVRDAFDAATAVAARTVIGGTASTSVRDQIAAAKSLSERPGRFLKPAGSDRLFG
jgi:argininosuccinate lyase